jgi:hypothetical protein
MRDRLNPNQMARSRSTPIIFEPGTNSELRFRTTSAGVFGHAHALYAYKLHKRAMLYYKFIPRRIHPAKANNAAPDSRNVAVVVA